MKTIKLFLFLSIFLLMSCEKNEIKLEPVDGMTEGFCIVVNDEVVLNHTAIDYYDFSEHTIYLKDADSFLEDTIWSETFTVYANMDSIYSGYILSSVSSFLPEGPVIRTDPWLRENNTIPIGCIFITDASGNTNIDPRGDEKIIKALRKYNQFHE